MIDMDKTNKIKIIALFGKSGAGKDAIQKWMAQNIPQVSPIISCTTRPARENEEYGKDYFFLRKDNFDFLKTHGYLLEWTEFIDWEYGTAIESLNEDNVNVGVFNIAGIAQLRGDARLVVLPVLVQACDKTRLRRCLGREDNPNCHEICRRFLADEKDFANIPFPYVTFENNSNNKDFSGILDIDEVKHFIHKDKND